MPAGCIAEARALRLPLRLQYDSRYGGSQHGRLSVDLDGSQHLAARLESVPEERDTPRQQQQHQQQQQQP